MRQIALPIIAALAVFFAGFLAWSDEHTALLKAQCHGTHELRGYHDKYALAAARGILDPWNYELDHYIPLCLGGMDDESNLWFQPWKEARKKDHLELALCGMVCRGAVTQKEAIARIRKAWPH